MTVLPPTPPVLPGAFGLTKITGLTGRLVAGLQGAGGHGSPFTHAFLVLDNGQVIEGQPGGAVLRPLADYLQRQADDPESVVFCDAPIRRRLADYGGGDPDGYLEATLRRMAAAAGRSLEGTPYSFLDYASLALLHTIGDGLRPDWLTDYIADSEHLICSALVDRAYELVGIELFDDRRAHGDVMPADLDEYRVNYLEELAEGPRA